MAISHPCYSKMDHFHHTLSSPHLTLNSGKDIITYDFEDENNYLKWKNLFVNSLRKILHSIHNGLIVEDEALIFIESLIFKLIRNLIINAPHNISELEERVSKVFPSSMSKTATGKASSIVQVCFDNSCIFTSNQNSNTLVGVGKKKKLPLMNIPNNNNNNNSNNTNWLANCSLVTSTIVEKIQELLSKEVFHCKIDLQLIVYLCSIIEFIAADILKLSGNYVRNMRHDVISLQDVKIAMNADQVLIDLFYGKEDDYERQEVSNMITNSEDNVEDLNPDDESSSYNTVVKDLIHEEKQFIRDLELIIKVFREPFIKLLQNSGNSSIPNSPTSLSPEEKPLIKEDDINAIFSNILDIYEFSVSFLGLIEDTVEMNEEGEGIGICFEEMAENAEFDVFELYLREMFAVKEGSTETFPQAKLSELLKDHAIIRSLDTGGHKFSLSVKYILPKLLLGPVVHCLLYFDFMRSLKNLASFDADKECFEQCEGVTNPLKLLVEHLTKGKNLKMNEGYLRLAKSNQRGKQAIFFRRKIDEMQKMVEGLDCSALEKECVEFIFEGFLYFRNERKTLGRNENKLSERYCFLFDSLMIACKPITRENNRDIREYKYKDRFYINKIEVAKSDIEPYAFELTNRIDNSKDTKGSIVMIAKTHEERCIWMSNLLFLSRKVILERTLDSLLAEEEKKNPLRLPSPHIYKFAEDDTNDNIIYESNYRNNLLIKGATLTKLIEKLTFHQVMDTMFVKIFLTTYRSFCSPRDLISSLIERFDIPFESEAEGWTREELKKFKKEYYNVVQFRVINVIKLWLDAHFYDFERDPELLEILKTFLTDKVAKERKNMNKWVNNLLKKIERKQEKRPGSEVQPLLPVPLPPIEYWLYNGKEGSEYEFNLLTVHPLEFARQLTLYEFDLYRAVKPSELIGLKWTKEGKEVNSANLLKISKHSNNVTYWLEKEIVETVNFEERVSLVSRILEILQVLSDLNNFNGILEVISALESACVHRLEHTFNAHSVQKHKKLIEEMVDLNKNHSQKYYERLRSINPPCVPFFGLYQTQILHLEEGNNDYIDIEKGLINFNKRRKIAEITNEIQGYQNQPYCLKVCPEIREFLENLNPIGESQSEKEFNDYLYEQSLAIEPRGSKQPIKGSKRWPYLTTLKSPGIKPSSHHSNHPITLPNAFANFGASSSNPTSPTLISPKTPPSTTLDTSVFANVIIGNTATSMPTSPPIISTTPPPLPPRSYHHQTSNSDQSSIVSNNTASPTSLFSVFNFNHPSILNPPLPPPRAPLTRVPDQEARNIRSFNSYIDQNPPPLPPKGISSGPSSARQTLPRRNSAESHSFDCLSSSKRNSCASHVHQNKPVIPPRTYKSNK